MAEIKKKQKPTKADLRRQVKEVEAQLASTYHFASQGLKEVCFPALAGSAVILELTALGGRKIGPPVAIRGGLSPETIRCLQLDIARSYEEAVQLKPVVYKEKEP